MSHLIAAPRGRHRPKLKTMETGVLIFSIYFSLLFFFILFFETESNERMKSSFPHEWIEEGRDGRNDGWEVSLPSFLRFLD